MLGFMFLVSATLTGTNAYESILAIKQYRSQIDTCTNAKSKEINRLEKSDQGKALILSGKAIHKILADQKAMLIERSILEENDQPNVYVQTVNLSHGFTQGSYRESASFYLTEDNNKVLVDSLLLTPVAGAKRLNSSSQKNWLWFPFYIIGLTTIDSYDVSYLSSGDSISIGGILEYSTKDGSFSMTEPAMAFTSGFKEAVDALKSKLSEEIIWAGIYTVSTIVLGALSFYHFKKSFERYSINIEEAKMTAKGMYCKTTKPKIVRRPGMHITEGTYCYNKENDKSQLMNRQCPKCGTITASINEIKN